MSSVMFRVHAAVLVVGLALDAHAKLADKFVVPFAVDPGCKQLGVAPLNLAAELPRGYDYSCYTPLSINRRWSTGHPVNASALFEEDADLANFMREYLLPVAVKVIPIAVFGIISAVACCGWSCCMLQCCCGKKGKCCDNPPKWVQGTNARYLLLAVVAMRVAVGGLAIKGIVVNGVQHDAITKLGGAVDLLDSWLDSATTRIDNVSTHLALLQADTNALHDTASSADTTLLIETFDIAADGISSLNTTVGTLRDSIASIKTLGDSGLVPANTYRHAGITAVWGVLLAMMAVELAAAAAAHMSMLHRGWGCVVTGLFIKVLSLTFIMLVVVAVITVVFGDICSSPDDEITTLINTLTEPSASTSTTTHSSQAAGDDSGAPGGTELMAYYITCDTNPNATNAFNDLVTDIFDSFVTANSTIIGLQPDDAVQTISTRFAALAQSLAGSSSLVAPIPAQGMTGGVFSLVQCYQVNARYHAVVGLVCGQLVGTMAMTLEYLLAAVSLMVAAEIGKRLLRPYAEDHPVATPLPNMVEHDSRWGL